MMMSSRAFSQSTSGGGGPSAGVDRGLQQAAAIAATAASTMPITSTSSNGHSKTFYFVRHGTTEMNEILLKYDWHHPEFLDGQVWDTRLSSNGIQQAITIHDRWLQVLPLMTKHHQLHQAKGEEDQEVLPPMPDGNIVPEIDFSSIEIVLASPLTRTMQTAHNLFCYKQPLLPPGAPRIVHPLLRERLYMSSDVGRKKQDLMKDFPEWQFDYLPNDNRPWWYHHDEQKEGPYHEWRPMIENRADYACKGEPKEVFYERLKELKTWLFSRPESTLLVIAHWGIIKGLTGLDFHNCQIAKVTSEQFLDDPCVP